MKKRKRRSVASKTPKKFRSSLERYCFEKLSQEKIPFEYEPYFVVLQDKFRFEGDSLEKVAKTFKKQRHGVAAIKYKPDFVGDGFVIETKGYFRPSARIKWKMFKKYLKDRGLEDIKLYMPSTQKEVNFVINEIHKLRQSNKDLKNLKNYR